MMDKASSLSPPVMISSLLKDGLYMKRAEVRTGMSQRGSRRRPTFRISDQPICSDLILRENAILEHLTRNHGSLALSSLLGPEGWLVTRMKPPLSIFSTIHPKPFKPNSTSSAQDCAQREQNSQKKISSATLPTSLLGATVPFLDQLPESQG